MNQSMDNEQRRDRFAFRILGVMCIVMSFTVESETASPPNFGCGGYIHTPKLWVGGIYLYDSRNRGPAGAVTSAL